MAVLLELLGPRGPLQFQARTLLLPDHGEIQGILRGSPGQLGWWGSSQGSRGRSCLPTDKEVPQYFNNTWLWWGGWGKH